MVQKNLPLINSSHGSETRNIINELIKIFNSMGYSYNEALQKAHEVLNMNVDVQSQLDGLIIESGNANAEVSQARGGFPLLKDRLINTEKVFRWKEGTSGSKEAVNTVIGYKDNDVSPGIRGAHVQQGSLNNENIVGGFISTVGVNEQNVVNPEETGAHYVTIGGYDNVGNGLASILYTMHSYTTKDTTHTAIIGGSYQKADRGHYSFMAGGTENILDVEPTNSGSGYSAIISSVRTKVKAPYSSIMTSYESEAIGEFATIISSKWAFSRGLYATNIGSVSSEANGNTSFNIGTNNSKANGSGSGNLGSRYTENNGNNSLSFGTDDGLIDGDNSYLFGAGGWAKNQSQMVLSGGVGDVKGDRQTALMVLSTRTNGDVFGNFGFNGTSLSPTIEPGYSWAIEGVVTARFGDAEKMWKISGLFRRTRSGTTELLVFTREVVFEHGTASAWDVSALAGTGTFALRGRGAAGHDVKWVASIRTTENAWV